MSLSWTCLLYTSFEEEAKKYDKPLAVEKEPPTNFIKAEDYHQDYLKKHPNGYCHIDVNQASYPVIDASRYSKPSDEEIKKKLSPCLLYTSRCV